MKKLGDYTFGVDVFCNINFWVVHPDEELNKDLWDMVLEWRKHDYKILDHISELAKLYNLQRDVISKLEDLVNGIKWNYDSFNHRIQFEGTNGYVESHLYWDLSGLRIRIELYVEGEKND